jgi:hypothetical protein
MTESTYRDWLELSLAQQAIWLESKLNPESALQLGGWAKIVGELDEAIVRQAVSLVMARHDALRLRADEEHPRQWLENSSEPPFSVGVLPDAFDQDAAFQDYLQDEFKRPMPLGDHSLFSISLLKGRDGQSYMLWRFHHLIADSVSTTMAMRHWTEAYLALTSDTPPELAPRSSYQSVIDADMEYLRSQNYKQDLDYWMRRFDPLPPLFIDASRRRQNSVSASLFYQDWCLQGEDWVGLQQFSNQCVTTPIRALFALFALVIALQFGEFDTVSGIALHRRDRSTWRALGVFSGVIPVRFRFSRSGGLIQSVKDFSGQIDKDLRHQRMPVDNLARHLQLFRQGRSRLFDVVMSYLPSDRVNNELLTEEFPVTSDTVSVPEASPISLHLTELVHGVGLQVRIATNPSVLTGTTARNLLSQLQTVERHTVAHPSDDIENLLVLLTKDHAIVEGKGYTDDDREEWII